MARTHGGEREALVLRAVGLSAFSVVWGLGMAGAALVVAIRTRSLSLAGFALDSAVDSLASVVLLWRFLVERRDPRLAELVEARSERAVGAVLVLVGLSIGAQAARALVNGAHPSFTAASLAVVLASLAVLPALAYLKWDTAKRIPSRALHHDGFLTAMAAVLAAVALAGAAVGRGLGLEWADAAAAAVIAMVVVVDGVEAIRAPSAEARRL